MELLINKKDNRGGVYKITNLINNKVYIGGTWSVGGLYGRAIHHRAALNRNDHGNEYLQHAVNKYGIENFRCEVQEVCYTRKEVPVREKFWIMHYDALNPLKGYNIAKDTEHPFRGIPKSKRWHDKRDKEYHLLDPQGNEVHVKGMRQFCRDNELCQGNMGVMLRGGSTAANGWRLYKFELVGVPYSKSDALRVGITKQWSKRNKFTVDLPYTHEEIINFYLIDKLSIKQIATKCGKHDHTYVYKILKHYKVDFRKPGGSTQKGIKKNKHENEIKNSIL